MNGESEARASVARAPREIDAALRALLENRGKVVSFLSGGELLFESELEQIDPELRHISLRPSCGKPAIDALLAQPRCIFTSFAEGWRIEFVAAAPSRSGELIRVAFPEALARWRRAHERTLLSPGVPLQCVADSEGVMPFEGLVVDIGPEGLGFLIHSESITLEPGTVLKNCLIDIPGRGPCKADLEVCYSQPIVLGDGTHSVRSGCRFMERSGSIEELVRFYLQGSPPGN